MCLPSPTVHTQEVSQFLSAGRIKEDAAGAVQAALGADKVDFEQGVYLDNYGADWQMENAAKACDGADAAIIFLGLSSIKDHRIPQPDYLQVNENWARPPHNANFQCLTGLPCGSEGGCVLFLARRCNAYVACPFCSMSRPACCPSVHPV